MYFIQNVFELVGTSFETYLLIAAFRLPDSKLTLSRHLCGLGMNIHVDFMRHHWLSAVPNVLLLFSHTSIGLYCSMCNLPKSLRRPESTLDLPFVFPGNHWLATLRLAGQRIIQDTIDDVEWHETRCCQSVACDRSFCRNS